MGTRAKMERWFDAGVKGLTHSIRVLDDDGDPIEDVYPCPLCFTFFRRGALDEKLLTFEHVPPATAGGVELVLTCADCNHWSGTKVDAEVAKLERVRAGLRGERPLDVKIDGHLNAEMHVLPAGGFHLEIPVARNHPVRARKWAERMSDPNEAMEVSTHLRDVVDQRKVRLSMLRAGFLTVFAMEGYRHILGRGYLPFRRQLASLDEPLIPVLPVLSKPDWPEGVHDARHSSVGPSLMVGFNEWRVLLPAHPDDIDWLERFRAEHDAPTEKIQVKRTPRPTPSAPQHGLDLASSLDGTLERVDTFKPPWTTRR